MSTQSDIEKIAPSLETLKTEIDKENEPKDEIYEALLDHPNGTKLIQMYLDYKQLVNDSTDKLEVLNEANAKLRAEYGSVMQQLKETRRALDGRIPAVIEVVKEVNNAPPTPITTTVDETRAPTMAELRAFFED